MCEVYLDIGYMVIATASNTLGKQPPCIAQRIKAHLCFANHHITAPRDPGSGPKYESVRALRKVLGRLSLHMFGNGLRSITQV
jgi:hypothetical protein